MNVKHIRSANKLQCPACCCGNIHIHEGCGGTWHERVVDDTIEDGFVHNYRCDKCDEEEFQYGYEDCKIEFAEES